MKQTRNPLWKKSMLQRLNLSDITDELSEISENGDLYGYDNGEIGYALEYKALFDELSDGAYELWKTLGQYDLSEHWDDMTVALLGYRQCVLGFDSEKTDYFKMLDPYDEDMAVQEAEKRLMRLTKSELIHTFRNVMTTLVLLFDLKTAHDCLTAIIQELEQHAVMQADKDGTFRHAPGMWVE